MRVAGVLLCLLFLMATDVCGQKTNSSIQHQATLRLGDSVRCVYNRDATFVLCTAYTVHEISNLPVLSYLVFRDGDAKVVEEGSVTMADIQWTSTYELEVSSKKGQASLSRNQESTTQRIDVGKHVKRKY